MKKSELFFSAVAVPLDYLAVILAALVAYQIRFLPSITKIRPVVFDLPFKEYLISALILALVWLIIFALAGLYQIKGTRRQIEELTKVFLAIAAGMALVMAVMFFSRYLFESRFIILAVWLISFLLVSLERLILRAAQRSLYKIGIGVHRVVLVGRTATAFDLIKDFKIRPTLGYQVIAHFTDFNEEVKNQLKALAEADKFDEVIQTDPELPRQKILEIIDLLNDYHLDFKYTADLLGAKLSNFEIKTYDGVPVVELKRTPLDGWGRIFKRIFDLIFSLILIIIFAPVILVVAVAIKIDSAGPVFFKYQRIGQRGKPFTFLKFRSMIKDAHSYRFDPRFLEEHSNLRAGTPMMKFKDDPRVTRVGKFIRRWSLDEFPQFFLALAGKMSLVGPRPHEIEEVARYNKFQRRVLAIKPGVTGLAQVAGRSDLNFDEEIRLDAYYLENWSIGLDLQILLRTPLAVLKRRQAV